MPKGVKSSAYHRNFAVKVKEKKMTGKKFFTGIPGLILKFGIVVVLLCGWAGCASSTGVRDSYLVPVVYEEIEYSELESAIRSVDSPGHGFIVDAYIVGYYGDYYRYELSDKPNGGYSLTFSSRISVYDSDAIQYRYVKPYQFEIYDAAVLRRVDKTKPCKIYIGVYFYHPDENKSMYNRSGKETYIDKIEGLLTLEEVAAIEARQKAEAEAKEKAEAEARAAANEAKFNPNKLDRSLYKKITAEDFSFDMSAGKLPAGSKVAFEPKFPAGILTYVR
jgi:hypothetical protein